MQKQRWRERLAEGRIVTATQEELLELLEAAEVLSDQDTLVAGHLRVLGLSGLILVQEETPEGQLLVRRAESVEAAQALVADRLATYERMWDGCGCKVDYFG
jgi:hypothetical protein